MPKHFHTCKDLRSLSPVSTLDPQLDLVSMQIRRNCDPVIVNKGCDLLTQWVDLDVLQMRIQAIEGAKFQLEASLLQQCEGIKFIRWFDPIHIKE